MRAILIDPRARTVTEIESSYASRNEVIGGTCELAHEFKNGDALLVDANGFSRHEHGFDIGAHQAFAGPGLIVGTPGHRDAKTALRKAKALVKFMARPVPRPVVAKDFGSIEEAFSFLGGRHRPAVDVTSPSVGSEAAVSGIVLHWSLLDVADADLAGVEAGDAGLFPHIDLFPDTGLAELISHPVTWDYRVNDEGIRWYVPTGISAEHLKASLASGGALRLGLCAARAAALEDVGVLAACKAVSEELERLSTS